MTTVFISSTGSDLKEYRDAAIETANRLGLVPIAMELFEAMGIGATRGSMRKLRRADLYVGIYAHRYGYIEHGYDKAVTEIEFDYAGELGLDRLCFMVEQDYPWPPDQIDYDNYEKLKALKVKVNTSLIRAEFTTVDDFKFKLIQALTEWCTHRNAGRVVSNQISPMPAKVAVLPLRPVLMIGREQALSDLKSRLGITPDSQKQALTIIRGWPGVGKTTLVASLAHDEDVIAAFPDGILWSVLGRQPDPLSKLADWGHYLGVPELRNLPNLENVIGHLRVILQSKRMLLIVDDVWDMNDAVPFKQVMGQECSLMMTTRLGDVARNLASVPSEEVYKLDALSDEEAIDLLRSVAPTVPRKYSSESLELVRSLEGLPLAIRVAGRLLQSEVDLGNDIQQLFGELRESHILLDEIAPDDRFDPETGTTPSIRLVLQRSTDRLEAEIRDLFAILCAFAPKPATFDIYAMKSLWDVDDPMPTIRILVDSGLLEPIPTIGRFQIHAVLVTHAQSLLEA